MVEITSGGRGVTAWSVGINYGDGIGFQDNVIETHFGGYPSSGEPQARAEGRHGEVDPSEREPPAEGAAILRESPPDAQRQFLPLLGGEHGLPLNPRLVSLGFLHLPYDPLRAAIECGGQENSRSIREPPERHLMRELHGFLKRASGSKLEPDLQKGEQLGWS